MAKFAVDMRTFPHQNLMMIAFFYYLLLFIGYPILLGVFKLGYEVLDIYWLISKCFGNGADAEFILGDTFMIAKSWKDKRRGACPWSVFTWDSVGVVYKQPSLLIPSWRSQHHRVGDMSSTTRGSWVVDVIGHGSDDHSFFLWSYAFLCVWNDENNL